MKTNFHTRLTAVVAEAVTFLHNAVGKKKKIVLMKEEDIYKDQEETEEFLDLPTLSSVSKHGYYDQYAVMSLEKDEDEVILNCIGRGEDSDKRKFKLSELSAEDSSTVCYIADLVANK
jgi:hypothetical protein